MSDQPNILVKKADGTQERVTLPQLRRMRQAQKAQPAASATGASHAPVPSNTSQASNSDEHRSLLEEPIDTTAAQEIPPLPETQDARVDEIMTALPFSFDAARVSRARSLITSRLKEIRTDEQVRAYAQKPVDEGGLGLPAAQAEAFVAAIDTRAPKAPSYAPRKSRKPQTEVPPTPAPPVVVPSTHRAKAPVHDIVPPPPVPAAPAHAPIGPVEELAALTLADFRRLGDTTHARDVLLQKFMTLKDESYLLFLEAVAAWHKSPLYGQYISLLHQSLEAGTPIQSIVEKDAQSMRLDEVQACISIGNELL